MKLEDKLIILFSLIIIILLGIGIHSEKVKQKYDAKFCSQNNLTTNQKFECCGIQPVGIYNVTSKKIISPFPDMRKKCLELWKK